MGVAALLRRLWQGRRAEAAAAVAPGGAGLPGAVIYLAGDVGAALDRLARLRAQGIEVWLGLAGPLPREAFVIVDAPSFGAPCKLRHALGQLDLARLALPAMILTAGNDLLHRDLGNRLERRGPPKAAVLAAMARLGGLLGARWIAYAPAPAAGGRPRSEVRP